MPVPALITDLNTVAASNSPAGSETVFPNLDDYLRAGFSFTAQLNANKAPLASPAFTGTPSFAGSAVTWSGNPTHSGNHTYSGNVTINGNTVIGNASGDTLTVAPNAVTWSGNPTHSGNHTFSGAVTLPSVTGPTALTGTFTTSDAVTLGGASLDANAILTIRGNATPNAADVTGGRGTLYLAGWTSATPGNGVYGAAIAFPGVGTTRRKAMVAAYQDGATQGVTGLSFLVNGSPSITNEALTEVLKISSAGNVDLTQGSGSLRIGGLISRFESAEQTVPSATGSTTVAHGGTRAPDLVQIFLRCKTAELGYAVGDEVVYNLSDTGDATRVGTLRANATNVIFAYIASSGGTLAIRASAGLGAITAVTAANWRVVLKAHWL